MVSSNKCISINVYLRENNRFLGHFNSAKEVAVAFGFKRSNGYYDLQNLWKHLNGETYYYKDIYCIADTNKRIMFNYFRLNKINDMIKVIQRNISRETLSGGKRGNVIKYFKYMDCIIATLECIARGDYEADLLKIINEIISKKVKDE